MVATSKAGKRQAMPHALLMVQKATARIAKAEADRDTCICEAFDPTFRQVQGYTVDDIAEAAGLSRARIYQIVNSHLAERAGINYDADSDL